MISSDNLTTISGGLTRDATKADNADVLHLSIGVDRAGSEKGSQNDSGYFDAKVWLTPSKYTPAATAELAKKLFDEGALTKGARVSIVGQLRQERWVSSDNKKSSKVVLMVETINVYRKNAASAATETTSSSSTASAVSFDEF